MCGGSCRQRLTHSHTRTHRHTLKHALRCDLCEFRCCDQFTVHCLLNSALENPSNAFRNATKHSRKQGFGPHATTHTAHFHPFPGACFT